MSPWLHAYCMKLQEKHKPFGYDYEFTRHRLAKRESELEELFLVLWTFSHRSRQSAITYDGQPLPDAVKVAPNVVTIDLRSQVKIGRTRLDFLVSVHYPGGKDVRFAIECDGHSFHDRTPAQASADRKRDRRMLREGIVTIRFTFEDLTKRPEESISDLKETMKAFTIACQPNDRGPVE